MFETTAFSALHECTYYVRHAERLSAAAVGWRAGGVSLQKIVRILVTIYRLSHICELKSELKGRNIRLFSRFCL